jgi:hypothetical protein
MRASPLVVTLIDEWRRHVTLFEWFPKYFPARSSGSSHFDRRLPVKAKG